MMKTNDKTSEEEEEEERRCNGLGDNDGDEGEEGEPITRPAEEEEMSEDFLKSSAET